MVTMLKEEKDQAMMALVLSVITKVIDFQNYEWVINCVFTQFKLNQNLRAIRTVISIDKQFRSSLVQNS